jgi:Rrf2 family transcriptional regulator, nitric oxide-sensitive transcriptional repressor
MFSQTTEYALRVMVFLATVHEKTVTTRQLAAATRVPEGYLAKILQTLGRGGLVVAQRGLHGGSKLTRPPSQITILDVIDVIDPLPRIRTCPLELKSHGTNLCPLHKRLDNAVVMVEQALRSSSLAELIGEVALSIPLGELGTSAAAAVRAAELVFPVRRPVPVTISARPRGRKPRR